MSGRGEVGISSETTTTTATTTDTTTTTTTTTTAATTTTTTTTTTSAGAPRVSWDGGELDRRWAARCGALSAEGSWLSHRVLYGQLS